MRLLMPVVLLVAVLLAACAPAFAGEPRLVVSRAGGIAGVADKLVVDAEGTGTVTHRGAAPRRLTKPDTRAVRAALRSARFPTLAPVYRPPGTVADGFVYVLRSNGHRVRVEDGAENVPARLQALIAQASALLNR